MWESPGFPSSPKLIILSSEAVLAMATGNCFSKKSFERERDNTLSSFLGSSLRGTRNHSFENSFIPSPSPPPPRFYSIWCYLLLSQRPWSREMMSLLKKECFPQAQVLNTHPSLSESLFSLLPFLLMLHGRMDFRLRSKIHSFSSWLEFHSVGWGWEHSCLVIAFFIPTW